MVGSFIKPIGGSTPEPLDGRTSSFITDTDISLNQDDIDLINEYIGTNNEIPNEEEIKSSNNLKKVKDVLGRIRGVQLRSGSASDKDGRKKLVIDSIDKVRKWIGFITAADSSRVKPIQVTKADQATQTSPHSTKKKRRDKKKGMKPKSPELSSQVPKADKAVPKADKAVPKADKAARFDDSYPKSPELSSPVPKADQAARFDDSYPKSLEIFPRHRMSEGVFHTHHKPFEGSGIRFYKSPGELVERLGLLCASREAGNTSKKVINELVEILHRLLNEKRIKKSEYKKLYKTYV